MVKFKLMEFKGIEENTVIYYYSKYIPKINLGYGDGFYYRDKPKRNYFLKNKDKYLFIKYNYDDYYVPMYIFNKEYSLLNMDKIRNEFGKGFYRFIKYHLIKYKLNKN